MDKKKVLVDDYFEVQRECVEGFQEHVSLNLIKEINDTTLRRRRLFHRQNPGTSDQSAHIKKIIQSNSSLRLYFGWSFESTEHLRLIVHDCLSELLPKFPELNKIPRLVSDYRGDWLGFSAYNIFEQTAYEGLDLYRIILFNNSLIDLQADVVKFIIRHPVYLDHAVCRDDNFRFERFRSIRRCPDELENEFENYLRALENTTGLRRFPKEVIEQAIGVHYLHHPDLFFQLMDFYSLKGVIYD